MKSFVDIMKTNLVVLIIISLVIFIFFGKLTETFYQQDEWYVLGLVFAKVPLTTLSGVSSPLDFLLFKGRLLASFIFYLFAYYFPLQNVQLAIFAIVLHIIATFLVFILIRKFVRSFLFSLLGALFFAVNAVSHGAVTWSAIAISAVGSTVFVLIGLLFFFKYLADYKVKWLIFCGLMIYLSLWFKETGLYMFMFLPLSALLLKRYSVISFFKTYWFFCLPFLFITTFRVAELYLRHSTSNLYITGLNDNFFSTIIMRSVLYPLTSFSLIYIPGDQFLLFARAVLRQIYPFFASASNNILIAQSVILDLLSVILTFIILIFIYLLWQKDRLENKRFVIFWIVFSFMSFLPYVLLSKDFSYLESRYYYLSVVGGAVLLSWVLKRLWDILGPKIFYIFVLPLIIVYLVFHGSVVYGAISEQVKLANLQKSFISQLKILVPTLDNKKNVFYTTSDQNFWAEGNKLPFQQGSGYTLMVLYFDSGKIPKEFLKAQGRLEDGFLFGIGSQGYKEINDLGFGYFWDKGELEKAIKLHNLTPDSIIRLQYNSDENNLTKVGTN